MSTPWGENPPNCPLSNYNIPAFLPVIKLVYLLLLELFLKVVDLLDIVIMQLLQLLFCLIVPHTDNSNMLN